MEPFGDLVGEERYRRFMEELAPVARTALEGRRLWNINSTAGGGGVAEMLHTILGYARSLGIDARWMVLEGDEEFFAITKRVHNGLYGLPGDGGPLGRAEADHYEAVMHNNAAELAAVTAPGDVVLLHDPQPAGLASWFAARSIPVVWRCHVGVDEANEWTDRAWDFLRPFLEPYVDRYVFTRREFAPAWIPDNHVYAISPSIDPWSPKNEPLSEYEVHGILGHVGLLSVPHDGVEYKRTDGTPGRIEHFCDIVRTGPPPGVDVPLVVQVSRWDRLKDMSGLMQMFAEYALRDHDAHLVLAGPVVTAVADDPEGADVLDECIALWRGIPHAQRRRIHLACLPMTDLDENAVIVNALQRHASVVVQKSLAEGFGLTVVEAMFKGSAVVASAVGGIKDQVVDGRTGVLLEDPTDTEELIAAFDDLLVHPEKGEALGAAAREHAIELFLSDTHLARWLEVLGPLLDD
jgi:trehalose synthase